MGHLRYPILSKCIARSGSHHYRVGAAEMQGFRDHMEDNHTILCSLGDNNPDVGFFGVFDGHSGKLASQFISTHLPNELSQVDDLTNPDKIKQATFSVEHKIMTDENTRQSGSTAVFGVVKPKHNNDYNNYEISLANVGDSLGMIISSDGKVKFVTRAHIPTDPSEQHRISSNGGFVHRARVDGRLAMSRSIGDAKYKDLYQSNELMNFVDQKVSSEADVVVMDVQAGDMLLLCSDGVTADLSTDDIASFIVKHISQAAENVDSNDIGQAAYHNIHSISPTTTNAKSTAIRVEEKDSRDFARTNIDPGTICSRLLDLSFAEGSTDNMTALLVVIADGTRYVHNYIHSTKADQKPTTKLIDRARSEDIYDSSTVVEFIPGPYHKYSTDNVFVDSYMSFADRHGFKPQYDDNNKLKALVKANAMSRELDTESPALPSFDEYTSNMRKKGKYAPSQPSSSPPPAKV